MLKIVLMVLFYLHPHGILMLMLNRKGENALLTLQRLRVAKF